MPSRSLRVTAFALLTVSALYPAPAQRHGHAPPFYHDRYDDDRQGWAARGEPRPYRDDRFGPQRSRCDRGTGGTILGAIAGGLLGNGAAGRGDRPVGAIVGAGADALAGRAIDRDC